MCIFRIQRKLLDIALNRAAPARISRSGAQGEAVNCYITQVFRKTGQQLVIESISGNMLNCLEYDGNRYSIQSTHTFESLVNEKFEFTHYYGLATIIYSGWLKFALGRIFKLPYLQVWFIFKKTDLLQFIYNRKKLVTKERIDLLKVILLAQLDGAHHVSSLSVMSLIHTDMWYLHPNKHFYLNRVEFYLNALTETKDLLKIDGDYAITGQGIEAIEHYEEEERKHSENIGSQRGMIILTFVIMTLTLFQTGIVKLPILLDFTK